MRKTIVLLIILLHVTLGGHAQDILTTSGLGPVKIGETLKDIPEAYSGLYASKGMERDETVFFDENKQEVFRVMVGEDSLVNLIVVISPAIRTPEGAHVGMTKQEVERLKDATYIKPDLESDYPRDSYELNGIYLLMDWEDQGIVTEMTASSFDDGFDVAIKKQKKVHDGLLKYFKLARFFKDLLKYLNEIAQLEYVKKAYFNDNTLFVEIDGFGTVSYSKFPERDADNSIDWARLQQELNSIVGHNPDMFKQDNIVIASQVVNDLRFREQQEYLFKFLPIMFEKSGAKEVSVESPTMKFFLNDIFNHTLVFLDTHGIYNANKNLHWLATSDVITNFDRAAKEYRELIKAGMVSIGYACTEERQGGLKLSIPYFYVSEKLIYEARNQFAWRKPVIVFNLACSSMAGNDNLGVAFRNKGAYMYLGYGAPENVGVYSGMQFFGRLLSGMSVEGALKSLDERVVHNVSVTPDKQPVDAWLKWSPVEGTIAYNNIKDYYYVKPEVLDDHVFMFQNMPFADNEGKIVRQEEYILLRYSGKMPLHWVSYPSKDYNGNKWGKMPNIPLMYGFEICSDSLFERDTIRIIVPFGKKLEYFSDITKMRELEVESTYEQSMVTFTMRMLKPLKAIPWNEEEQKCYLRPVVYDPKTKTVNAGWWRWLRKKK